MFDAIDIYSSFFSKDCISTFFSRFLTINLHKNMKPALRLIPLETWVEVFSFPWIEREELGKIVDRFFRNRKFAEFLQFYLHDWGKHTLKHFYIQQVYLIWFLNTAHSTEQHLSRGNAIDAWPIDWRFLPEQWLQYGLLLEKRKNWRHEIDLNFQKKKIKKFVLEIFKNFMKS